MLLKSLKPGVSDHSVLSNRPWSVAGHTIDEDVDFQNYKALAMAFDSGATLPAAPVDGQPFLHTPVGRKVFCVYDSADAEWKCMFSYGSMTMYVDATDGTDSQDKGGAVDAGAFATFQFAIDQIPGLVGGNVTININNESYSENVVIQGKNYTGNYTITLQGTLVSQESGTWSANGVTGTGGTQGSGTDTGAFTGDSYENLLLLEGGDDVYRIIDSHNNNTAIIVGTFESQPQIGETWEVFDWGTDVDSIEIGVGQGNIVINDIEINTAASVGAIATATGILMQAFSSLAMNRCSMKNISSRRWFHYNGPCSVFINTCSFHTLSGNILGLQTIAQSLTDITYTKMRGPNNGNEGRGINVDACFVKISSGSIVDGFAFGVSADRNGVANWSSGAAVGYSRVRNCGIGLLAIRGGVHSITSNIQYSGNSTDESPSGASDPAYID